MSSKLDPQETIPNFIQKSAVIERPQRYVSNALVMKTTGPTVVETPHSANYVKKLSKESKLPEIKQHVRNVYCTCATKKPMISAGAFLLPAGLPAKRMFTATPKVSKPPLCVVDTNKGHKEYPNKFSGLVPVYVKKKDYGEVPAYLLRRKGKLPKEGVHEKRLEESEIEIEIENLTDEECREIIEDLKKKCMRLNMAYQRLPFVIDTPSLKMRKTRLEGDLQQLENDLKLLETLVSNK
ncbi:enkurin-like [Dunckerocampus dactyliophorus]|uniref:enkurin-like n=1 Tax=Dunckerocampus dactyliophorus TaxID=161453 RepID=UPI0024075EF4|nr:enkurin-like [Dunckerocampus dactyliophorus]